MAKRVEPDRCCGVIVDVQDYFLSQIESNRRSRILSGTKEFARLLRAFKIPMVATLERPVGKNGRLPRAIEKELGRQSKILEKSFFDLSREKAISEHIAGLDRKQIVMAGCETDVCILQSCLGLLDQGYEVFLIEDLLFSGTKEVNAAITRMQAAGATFASYKTLYYELTAAVEALGNPET